MGEVRFQPDIRDLAERREADGLTAVDDEWKRKPDGSGVDTGADNRVYAVPDHLLTTGSGTEGEAMHAGQIARRPHGDQREADQRQAAKVVSRIGDLLAARNNGARGKVPSCPARSLGR